jgi:hypothetical protein
VAAARFVAVVHAVVPVVAGAAGMRYRRFLGWSALGATAWSLLYVSIGTAAGTSWRQFGERLGLAGLAVLGAGRRGLAGPAGPPPGRAAARQDEPAAGRRRLPGGGARRTGAAGGRGSGRAGRSGVAAGAAPPVRQALVGQNRSTPLPSGSWTSA